MKFYLTTPIYYVNGKPHLGHAYTTVIGDAIARSKKIKGYDVFYLTGTDEHGGKIEKAARSMGKTPRELADEMVPYFKDLWKALDIEYDFFIRTTMDFHEKRVAEIFEDLKNKGYIYKGSYSGWYCYNCEAYIPDDAEEVDGVKICPDCGGKGEFITEENYFFRLSAFQKPLLDFYRENPDFVKPRSMMNKVVSFVEAGLRDLSITRTTINWGIRVPSDPKHVIYVWFDALFNYITALRDEFEKWWPADLHIIGKDIIIFHAVYWPAFLMALGYELPRTILSHGWWLVDRRKMSKHLGNVLDPNILIKNFGADAVRYFLLRETPIGQDGNFSHEGFLERYNADLANELGNIVSRTTNMAVKYFQGNLPAPGPITDAERKMEEEWKKVEEVVDRAFENYEFSKGLARLWGYLRGINKYLVETEPWRSGAREPARTSRILLTCFKALNASLKFIIPVMPEAGEKIKRALSSPGEYKWEAYDEKRKIEIPELLFPRVDKKEFFKEEIMEEKEGKKEEKKEEKNYVTIEEFFKMGLKVGKIVEVKPAPNADKLYLLKVDMGDHQRNLVAGLRKYYSPEELLGKKIVVVTNLKPAKIRGHESQGMLLAADVDGKPYLLIVPDEVPPGSQVR